ncbi:MAG: hypothetical protein LUC93_12800 [Planctomycetaceae bacterium]|nr:hypothetical protein [Planctomycetaceae bacterium]
MSPDRPDLTALGPIVLAYDNDALAGDAASRDVLDQLDAVEAAVAVLGGTSVRVGMDLDLGRARESLRRLRPVLVVNLVESLGGSDRLQTVAAMLFEDMGLAFTGTGSLAMALSNHKLASKRRLADAGVPVPAGIQLDASGEPVLVGSENVRRGDWIVKTLESHASLFMDDGMVLRDADIGDAVAAVRAAAAQHGQPFFAEQFIDGREFNLSVVDGPNGPEVLPPAEIRFIHWEPSRPRIVGYAAKWEEESELYQRSVRHFDFTPEDAGLLSRLRDVSLAVWKSLDLAGYGRVDFRVDADGAPFVLEANANPCITPGAGFAAAAEQAGISYTDLIGRIASAALRRSHG